MVSTAVVSTAVVSTAVVSTAMVSAAVVSTAVVSTVLVSTAMVSAAVVSTAVVSTVLVSTAVISTVLVSTAVISTAVVSTAVVSTAVVSTAMVSTAVVSTAVVSTAVVSTAVVSAAVVSTAVVSCVFVLQDSRLKDILQLLQDGLNKKTIADRINYGLQLKTSLEDFAKVFLPHMEEEEEVGSPNSLLLQHLLPHRRRRGVPLAPSSSENFFPTLMGRQVASKLSCSNISSPYGGGCAFPWLPRPPRCSPPPHKEESSI